MSDDEILAIRDIADLPTYEKKGNLLDGTGGRFAGAQASRAVAVPMLRRRRLDRGSGRLRKGLPKRRRR